MTEQMSTLIHKKPVAVEASAHEVGEWTKIRLYIVLPISLTYFLVEGKWIRLIPSYILSVDTGAFPFLQHNDNKFTAETITKAIKIPVWRIK